MNIQDIGRLCRGTPTITVQDNRGLIVREIQFNRTRTGDELDTRITRHTYNTAGHLQSSLDPRFFKQLEEAPTPEEKAKVPRNFRYITSLSGQQLRIDSIDAGSRVTLTDVTGAPMLELDERGTTRRFEYEDALHRPTAVIEQSDTINNGVVQVSERFVYGDNEPDAADNNLIGQLVRHYDNAGLWETNSISLTGQPLCETLRLLLSDTDDSDWQGVTETDWKAFLEPDVTNKRYTTSWLYNALGKSLQQTDAMGNQQRTTYYVSGRLQASYLILAGEGQTEQIIVSGLEYSAHGQKLRERAGNGVVTEYRYDDKTLRLVSVKTTRPPKANRPTLLQDLRYSYDPVGNILAIKDQASATRFYKNQQVSAENTYEYDALYQLISATGRENVTNRQSNSSLPTPAIPISTDSSQLRHYHRTYCYDRGGNLEQIKHLPTNATGYTTTMVVSDKTNRAVQQNNLQSIKPEEVDDHFDVYGNLKMLGHSKSLSWDRRNQLAHVQITASQHEVYQYTVQGQRIRKAFTETSTGKREQVIYLPGLELRCKYSTGQSIDNPTEILNVLTVGDAGRAQVRVMHWSAGKPAEETDIPNNQLRYSLDNYLGSSNLELNQSADIITQEEYYPFGGTAVWSARNQTEAKYKVIRYSGKERDVTGLYYYGYRYYASWMSRWLNPDPAWTIDGLNLYRMVRNNPVTLKDNDGRAPDPKLTAANLRDIEALTSAMYSGHERYIVSDKTHVGFISGEQKAQKPPLSTESQANMTYGVFHKLNKAMYHNGPISFIGEETPASSIETILIHGTFNPDAPEVGWTRPELAMNKELKDRFGGNLVSMQWSGKNHRHARIEAGSTLAARLNSNSNKGIKTNIVAHSHGGNVAFEAIKQIRGRKIDQLITLGTPIREDHLPSIKELRDNTEGYLHISGGEDNVAPKGGIDFVQPGKGLFSSKASYALSADLHSPIADLELHITDSSHSELHARAIINLLGRGRIPSDRCTHL
ncbi:RHS repeat-associated core domain-containing protein [Vibrio artabrorum]|uniref:RHS repeat-associated core domain-containing protein n=1 Tax=Vibrio artabrorum TaxID=446374 RepID=UPI00354C6E8E